MDKLQGADILTYLTSRQTYNEQMIAIIIAQVSNHNLDYRVDSRYLFFVWRLIFHLNNRF